MSGSRDETLKDHLVGVARRPFALLRRAHRPGQQRTAKDVAGNPGRRRRQLVDPEGDEMRLGAKRRGADTSMLSRCSGGQLLPVVVIIIALRDDAARQALARSRAAPAPDPDRRTCRPRGRNRRRAPPPSASPVCGRRRNGSSPRSPAAPGRRPASQRSSSDIIRSDVSLNLTAFSSAAVLPSSAPRAFGEAAERIVMMHHRLAVGGELDVDLDGKIAGDRGLHRARHVLDDAARGVMQAAMGDRPRRQPVRARASVRRPRTVPRPPPRHPPAARRRRRWCGHGGPCRRRPRPSGRRRRSGPSAHRGNRARN